MVDCQKLSMLFNCIIIMGLGVVLYIDYNGTKASLPIEVSAYSDVIGGSGIAVGVLGIIACLTLNYACTLLHTIGCAALTVGVIGLIVLLIISTQTTAVGINTWIEHVLMLLLFLSATWGGYEFLARCKAEQQRHIAQGGGSQWQSRPVRRQEVEG